jgi:hypothetical protein
VFAAIVANAETWVAVTNPEDLRLIRAFEPVVRLTQGEFFVPVVVDEYVRNCSLWTQTPDGGVERVAEPGHLDLDELARLGAAHGRVGQSLSGISVPHSRRQRISACVLAAMAIVVFIVNIRDARRH